MSEQLQPEIQPPMKKQNSYTYWVDPNNKSRQLPPEHLPKKLEGPIDQVPVAQGPSAWNSLGTWEEKHFSMKQLENAVTAKIKEFILKTELQQIELSKVDLEGDAYKVYKKNKWNIMYDLKGSIEFSKQSNKGKVKVVQISNLGDRQFEVSGSTEIKKIISPNADAFIKIIQTVLAQFAC